MSSYKNLSEFLVKWKEMKLNIRTPLEMSLTQDCLELTDDIRKRIVNKGEKADGSSFSPYSKTGKWKKVREANNLQTGYKNFSFSGNLLDSNKFTVTETERGENKIRVTIGVLGNNVQGGGRSVPNEKVLEGHSVNEGGSIIEANEKEEEKLVESLVGEVFNFIKQSIG